MSRKKVFGEGRRLTIFEDKLYQHTKINNAIINLLLFPMHGDDGCLV